MSEYHRGKKDGYNNQYKTHKGALGAFLTGWSSTDEKRKKNYDKGYTEGRKNRFKK